MRVPESGGEGAEEYGVDGGSDHGGSGGLSGSLYSIVVVSIKIDQKGAEEEVHLI